MVLSLRCGALAAVALLLAAPTGAGFLALPAGKLVPAAGAHGDAWGMSVAVDGEWAVVGAPHAGPFTYGSASVLRKVGAAWTEFAVLTPADPAYDAKFGEDVDVSGDAIVVGAPGRAAAYVFRWDGTAWTQEAKLTAPAVGRTLLGHKVAIDGDLVAVGDALSDSGQGAIQVFRSAGAGAWTHEARLADAEPAAGGLGWALDADGGQVLAGAYLADGAMTGTGAAYLFTKVAGAWTQSAKLQASDGVRNDQFGRAVALDGATAAVGSYWDDTPTRDAGSAYTFAVVGGAWAQTGHYMAPDPIEMHAFGWALDFQDGRLAVGAMHDDGVAPSAGAVYLYPATAAGLPHPLPTLMASKLKAADAETGAHFGVAVALDGDTLLVGAPTDDWAGAHRGAAYAYEWRDLADAVSRAAGL